MPTPSRGGGNSKYMGDIMSRKNSLFHAMTLVLLSMSSVSGAQSGVNAASSEAQSDLATRLFWEVCFGSAGDENGARNWVRSHNLRLVDPASAAKVLNGKPGEVWLATSSVGDFVVILNSPRECSVWARHANSDLSMQQFQKLVHGVARPGLTVKKNVDAQLSGRAANYRMVGYTIATDGADGGIFAEAITSDSRAASVQVRLKVAPVKVTQ